MLIALACAPPVDPFQLHEALIRILFGNETADRVKGSLEFSHLPQISARTGIIIAIFAYLLIILWAYRMEREWEFYALAVAVGLVQGGIQALSRSFYARLIPRDKSGEFFGFYNTLGKFAAVIGPVMMGWIGVVTGSPRLSILSLAALFLAGALLLILVDEQEGRQMARALEADPMSG